jgi:hypothetical protein
MLLVGQKLTSVIEPLMSALPSTTDIHQGVDVSFVPEADVLTQSKIT